MPKFYVQCGPRRSIIQAGDRFDAVMHLIDRALQDHLWIYDDVDLSDTDRRRHLLIEALLHLDPAIRISEQGFDREDASVHLTPEAVSQWHALMVGVSRLFEAAGLPPRPFSAVAASGSSPSNSMRPLQRPR